MVTRRTKNRLTRLGVHFLFVGAFAMLGGSIRGLNLLLILSGVTIGALLIQWRVCKRMCERISVSRQLPAVAFAGQRFGVAYRVRNATRWVPAWMLRVVDFAWRVDVIEKDCVQSETQSRLASPVIAESVLSLGCLPAGQSRDVVAAMLVMRRGRYQFSGLRVSTAFPFALMTATKSNFDDDSLLVLPRILKLHPQWVRRLRGLSGGTSALMPQTGGIEGEFYGLRDWQTGDTFRQIHWRTTARLGRPAVRNVQKTHRAAVCIVVDAFLPDNASERQLESLEIVVSVAASLADRIGRVPVNRVVLAVADGIEPNKVAPNKVDRSMGEDRYDGAAGSTREILRRLAMTEGTPEPNLDAALDHVIRSGGQPSEFIVVSTRSMESLSADSECTQFIRRLAGRGRLHWINQADGTLDGLLELQDGSAVIANQREFAEAKA